MTFQASRTAIVVPARMRIGARWGDITIQNMSSRGLMAESAELPKLRSFVEIRRGTQIIVGQVMWARGHCFGLHTQDELDLTAISDEPRLSTRKSSIGGFLERRKDPGRRQAEQIALREERSRYLSLIMQFLVLAAVAALAAGLLASEVYRLLIAPLQAVGTHL